MSRDEERAFNDLLDFVERELAFEAGFYNDAYLDRRISARMRRTDHDEYATYRQLLERDEAEREALLDALSITVTEFFRDPEAWEQLRSILRELTDSHSTVRIWSAPCADGREPYSVAMLAMDDDEIEDRRVEIVGTDINADVLETARAGIYETTRTSDIEAELALLDDYTRYVDREQNRFVVRDKVKETVDFEHHDLIRGDPKGPFDLVLCRNLLIYIDPSYKTPILRTIRRSLREGGYLMVGMTETLPTECRDEFEPVSKRQRIYRRM